MSKKSINYDLLVISHGYGTFIKDQIEQISDNFANVTVFSRYNPISEISNIIPINYLKPFRRSSIIDQFNKPSNVNIMTTPVFYFPTESGYKKLGEKHLKAVKRKIDRSNIMFNLIHSHFLWSAGYVGAKLKEIYDVPFVVTAHGYDIYDLPFRDHEWEEKIRYVLNSSDYIITVSERNKDCIKKLDTHKPVKVIANGFDGNFFKTMDMNECRIRLNLPLDKKIVLNVGNLYDEIKGHEYLIESINKIIKYRKDVLCIIIGSGKLKNKLQKQIKKSGLEQHVKLLGGKPHNEIPLWINACDVFILPSLDEGVPTVMFECLGCGKPFIGTNVGGIPEIIIDEDYGFVVEPKNSEQLAEILLIAVDKDWDSHKILKYAYQFEWGNLAKEIQNIYDILLENI